MTFFFLPEQHPLTLEVLPDGRFYTKGDFYIVKVPYGCAPGWCEYTGDWADGSHSWKNPISHQVHDTHPLGLTTNDSSFTDGFYEITEIKGLTFGEGEAWCPDTNSKIPVEKTDPRSIWNPFFQRYDPPCDCFRSGKVKKKMDRGSYMHFNIFIQCRPLFFDVYCNCGMRDNREHQSGSDSD